MTLKAGNILEGTVVNITGFGAFVEIEGKTGLVHISEVSDSYVKDIRSFLKEKDKVKVKIISVDDNGKISLSMKQAMPLKKSVRPIEIDWGKEKEKQASPKDFEDRMMKFMKESEERLQDIKKNQDARNRGYRKNSSF
ncbi:S1 domain-containing RNA-binding protein [Clostridium malenominatum]|uniref:S1 domain-containing RNA-binding protein n=1 Tax=Clostridium malenominatum TaxID=1539 RepID=A0ABN1J1Q2_9CLOT